MRGQKVYTINTGLSWAISCHFRATLEEGAHTEFSNQVVSVAKKKKKESTTTSKWQGESMLFCLHQTLSSRNVVGRFSQLGDH